MSRNYRVLLASFATLGLLLGLVKLSSRQSADGASADTSRSSSSAEVDATDGDRGDASDDSAGTNGSTTETSVTDFVDGDSPTTVPPPIVPDVVATCTITEVLEDGSSGEQVECLQLTLTANGYSAAGGTFDAATNQAVRAFQTAKSLDVDGVVGRITAKELGIWAGGDAPLPARASQCPDTSHAALVDRANQVGWLCVDGALTESFPLTSAWSQPDPGTYEVYAKDLNASSTLTGQYSTMTHFVAFTKGKYRGARIAFHSVPKYSNGEYVQPLDSVGTEAQHGASSGCIRVLPDDAVMIWDHLAIGDKVRVIS